MDSDFFDFSPSTNISNGGGSSISFKFSKLEEINKENTKNYNLGSKIQPVISNDEEINITNNNNNNNSSTNDNENNKKSRKEIRAENNVAHETMFLLKLHNNVLKSKLKDLEKKINQNNSDTINNSNNKEIEENNEDNDFNNLSSFLDNIFKYSPIEYSNSNNNNKKSINSIEEISNNENEESEAIEKIDSILYETFKQLEPFNSNLIQKSNGYYFLEKLIKGFSKSDKITSDQNKLTETGIRLSRKQRTKNILNYINLLKRNIDDSNDDSKKSYYENELKERNKNYKDLIQSSEQQDEKEDEKNKERLIVEKIINEKNENHSNKLIIAKRCYVCKIMHQTIHHFYDSLCWNCGEFNYEKRINSERLDGRVAIVTGSRIKIGYETTLKLLRSGATVIATSRFPKDTTIRFIQEKDFNEWSNRLHVYALNLCDLKSLELFCTLIKQKFGNSINIIINNAAQTIKKPLKFYELLLKTELDTFEIPKECNQLLSHYQEIKELYLMNGGKIDENILGLEQQQSTATTTTSSNNNLISLIPKLSLISSSTINGSDSALLMERGEESINLNKIDEHGQPIDERSKTSWTQTFNEVPLIELLETHAISSFSPFIMLSHLHENIKESVKEFGNAFIINVNAMEGRFSRFYKSENHPHTNMAKASQNMFTRTSSCDLSTSNIYMNSVDTGWVTNESPLRSIDPFWQPPLDEVDGAARILDPIYNGLQNKKCSFGLFYKDYRPINW